VKRFKKFYIEITNVCNLACDFCPQTKRKAEFMDVEHFSKIVDEIAEYTDYLYFHVKGEPLMHPQLGEFLDICEGKKIQVTITTNGTLIPKVKEILLHRPAIRQINYSLHSFDGNEKNTGKDTYLGDILSFIKEAREQTLMIHALRLWNLTEDNEYNLEYKKNSDMIKRIEEEFSYQGSIQEQVLPGRGISLAPNVYLNQDHRFKWPDLKEEEDDGLGFCYGLRNQIAILVDGTVVPCCLDGEGVIALGNIFETPFETILQSERALNIIEGFSRREAVEELCRKCGYRKRFGK
jgi:radical SAM protein with 4Fe4S-binding SPASM domain